MISFMTETAARNGFNELIRRAVEQRETILVESDGRPMVAVLSVEEYERLNARAELRDDDALERAIAIGRSIRERRGTATLPHSETLLAEIRSARDAERDDLR